MTTLNDATKAQNRAADPAMSTWVTANAGSGKTRVLTDRVARLLLRNVPPQRILCLTYTKAAASHMQNQLFERLGDWAMLPDKELSDHLSKLGEHPSSFSDTELSVARTLFARALETPGGLKIQTIHSFCSALLRQFPLEAGVTPRFKEIDERNGRRLRADVLDEIAVGPEHEAFDAMAREFTGADLQSFVSELVGNRDAFSIERSDAEIDAILGLPEGYSWQSYLHNVLPEWSGDVLAKLKLALETGSVSDQKKAEILSRFDLSTASRDLALELENTFLFGQGTQAPFAAKVGSFPTKKVRNAHPDLMKDVEDLMVRFETERPQRLSLIAASKTKALHQFARAVLPKYAQLKSRHGWLDFDDLILKSRDLLTDSSMAQWVLFKLDGGIDHILVDEAQDTSPAQWAVVARLAEEFSAGAGARDVDRTLFVVGDEKQSIYSFQGADPEVFSEMRQHFDTRLAESQNQLAQRELLYSFRSSDAILELVDQVVSNDDSGGLPGKVLHRAFNSTLPGRVDVWPFIENPETPAQNPWYEPTDLPAPNDPVFEVAQKVASDIAGILERKESIPTTRGIRRIRAGDFLILVQTRSRIFDEIIKALKEKQLPVAGADRLKIAGELAVRDLTSFLSFLVLPEDDLSLAAVLRSPLLGLSEQDLFDLAYNRSGYLWPELRKNKDKHPKAYEIIADLLDQTDFLRPYEMLERILTRHRGRESLIARLGKEAEEGIDALLDQALQYEQIEAPSMTGFLSWMNTDESDVKRQMDADRNEIRVMTVHGAKGLESPIVILPDTAKRKPPNAGEILQLENGLTIWKPRKDDCPAIVREALEQRVRFQAQEKMRLLYVAMTRAESWLIVCGGGDRGKGNDSWYNKIDEAMENLGAVSVKGPDQQFSRYETHEWQHQKLEEEAEAKPLSLVLPDWCKLAAPTPRKLAEYLNPSDMGGAKTVGGEPGDDKDEQALEKGVAIHMLLEHLPKHAPSQWGELADALLAGTEDPEIRKSAIAEALGVLRNPDLADVFASDTLAEVKVTAEVNGQKLDGVIDRLIVSEKSVMAVDYKSNTVVPETAEQVPEGLLRQMGAYASALQQIYPERAIETAILWTKTASLMRIEHAYVTEALTRAAGS